MGSRGSRGSKGTRIIRSFRGGKDRRGGIAGAIVVVAVEDVGRVVCVV